MFSVREHFVAAYRSDISCFRILSNCPLTLAFSVQAYPDSLRFLQDIVESFELACLSFLINSPKFCKHFSTYVSSFRITFLLDEQSAFTLLS